ncbi:MAG: hypothetical protein ACYC43_05660 [Burkholderiales bacterium]
MKKIILMGLVGLILSLPVMAASIETPTVKAGDTWSYQNTIESGAADWKQRQDIITVSHVTPTRIYYTVKQKDSSLPEKQIVTDLGWSRIRDVNGVQTTVNKPLFFPLEAGKTWEIRYTEQHPNKLLTSETFNSKYTVTGYEAIEVPAGKFNAIKIEEEGAWTAELAPSQSVLLNTQFQLNNTTAVAQVSKISAAKKSGRTYKAFWYVPEVKRFVKSVEEYYGANGIRTQRFTSELESFKLAN